MKIKLIINAGITEALTGLFTMDRGFVDLLFPTQPTYSVYYLFIALLLSFFVDLKRNFYPDSKNAPPPCGIVIVVVVNYYNYYCYHYYYCYY